MQIKARQFNAVVVNALAEFGTNPLLARLFAARGVTNKNELETSLTLIIPPDRLTNNMQMAKHLADAIISNKKFW